MSIFSELLDPLTRVKEEYSRERFVNLGIPGYALPKMHSEWPLKPRFDDYKAILHHWVYKAFLHRHPPSRPSGSIVLFTWVMADGLGDWSAQMAAADVIKEAYPDLDVRLVTIISETEKASFSHPHYPMHLFRYGEKVPPELLKASLVIQIPTYYPDWETIKPSNSITIGEYGFIDSEWFHPQSDALCMGLNSLEKGLLFGKTPAPLPLVPHQYFAYLASERGYAVYLHALLASLKQQSFDITLYAANPLPLLKVLETEDFRGYGLSKILFSDGDHQSKKTLAAEGKTLRIFCKKTLPHAETQRLMLSSQPFVGCRGDRSFTEVVAANKLFFYDPRTYMRPFIHDLLDIVSHYLFPYPSLSAYIKTFLNTTTPAKILGHEISELLLDPTTSIGMQKLNALLKEEFTFNPTFKQLLTQPNHNKLDLFLENKISLEELLAL